MATGTNNNMTWRGGEREMPAPRDSDGLGPNIYQILSQIPDNTFHACHTHTHTHTQTFGNIPHTHTHTCI